ncbi:hypothetical protein [Gilliamella sp. Bif1-4]|uniref:hypothetical protein n=1 Tax=Gilliamella sp. Bif1-4 TaxID=3120233 RepID=UPI00080DEED2|nr:hypothetical protein [Gilliamella apicola]OCG40316.1 hypothetical protein A9G25_08175 [Gilliamella apicola]
MLSTIVLLIKQWMRNVKTSLNQLKTSIFLNPNKLNINKELDKIESDELQDFDFQKKQNFTTPINQFNASDFLNLCEHDINQKLNVEYPNKSVSFDFGYSISTWIDNNGKLECSFRDSICTDVIIWLKQAGKLIKVDSETIEKTKD